MKIKTLDLRMNENLEEDVEEISKFLASVEVIQFSSHFRNGPDNAWTLLIIYKEKPDQDINKLPILEEERLPLNLAIDSLQEDERLLAEALKEWRKEKARQWSKRPYMVFSNETLLNLVKSKPESITELENIKGFGQTRLKSMGEDIIALINSI